MRRAMPIEEKLQKIPLVREFTRIWKLANDTEKLEFAQRVAFAISTAYPSLLDILVTDGTFSRANTGVAVEQKLKKSQFKRGAVRRRSK